VALVVWLSIREKSNSSWTLQIQIQIQIQIQEPNRNLAVITFIISSGVAIALHMASCVLTSSFKLQSSGTGP